MLIILPNRKTLTNLNNNLLIILLNHINLPKRITIIPTHRSSSNNRCIRQFHHHVDVSIA
ncbi:hypothetical protein Hanom_Chr10g00890901 [Helianthus anomalus]